MYVRYACTFYLFMTSANTYIFSTIFSYVTPLILLQKRLIKICLHKSLNCPSNLVVFLDFNVKKGWKKPHSKLLKMFFYFYHGTVFKCYLEMLNIFDYIKS